MRLRWDKWKLTAFGLGKVIRGMNAARFARTLAILNQSSVPLLEGMKIAGDVMTNAELKRAVKEASVRVREGAGLKVSLQQCGYFPPMMLHMIAIDTPESGNSTIVVDVPDWSPECMTCFFSL